MWHTYNNLSLLNSTYNLSHYQYLNVNNYNYFKISLQTTASKHDNVQKQIILAATDVESLQRRNNNFGNIHNYNYKNNKIYREKSIPMTALWCPAFSYHG